MTPIRFFTDEDVYGSVAAKLREKGFDAVSTPEVDRLGENDEPQLTWAAQEGRVLLTFNVGDFARFHDDWLNHSRHHAASLSPASAPSATYSAELWLLHPFWAPKRCGIDWNS